MAGGVVELSGGSPQRPPSPSLRWETKGSFSLRSTVTWEAAMNVGHVSVLLLLLLLLLLFVCFPSPTGACAHFQNDTSTMTV
ncbi:hypothetical protein PBY51_001840 [Eleginops maclovinus]|uniref:Uncharacterized protein n=1 Tax=Eleginops maclovinus TaxID=56733 RepID=A0AAN7WX69_ELEMC|nr:hypothetical protein PBY51_001840 [Eleginops maclovinus]